MYQAMLNVHVNPYPLQVYPSLASLVSHNTAEVDHVRHRHVLSQLDSRDIA